MFDSKSDTVYKTESKADRVENVTLGEPERVAALSRGA